jgi:hypothetical protein
MPAQSPCRHALRLLKDKIARAKATVRRQEMLMEHRSDFVTEARLTATKLRLAQFCLERQRVRSEL